MSEEAIVVTLVSSIISGILATVITLYINYKREEQKRKQELIDDIFGYRYLLQENIGEIDKSPFNRAINRIPIIFNKNDEVLVAFDRLFEASICTDTTSKRKLMDDALVTLYKQMCKAAKIDVKDWNDSRIMRILSIR